jgi:hypothetical protein
MAKLKIHKRQGYVLSWPACTGIAHPSYKTHPQWRFVTCKLCWKWLQRKQRAKSSRGGNDVKR